MSFLRLAFFCLCFHRRHVSTSCAHSGVREARSGDQVGRRKGNRRPARTLGDGPPPNTRPRAFESSEARGARRRAARTLTAPSCRLGPRTRGAHGRRVTERRPTSTALWAAGIGTQGLPLRPRRPSQSLRSTRSGATAGATAAGGGAAAWSRARPHGTGVAVKLRRSAVSRPPGRQVVQQLERGATWGLHVVRGCGVKYAKKIKNGARFLPMAHGHAVALCCSVPLCPVPLLCFSSPLFFSPLTQPTFGSSLRGLLSPVLQCAARRSRCCSPQPLPSP